MGKLTERRSETGTAHIGYDNEPAFHTGNLETPRTQRYNCT